jgi:hypothetical protein
MDEVLFKQNAVNEVDYACPRRIDEGDEDRRPATRPGQSQEIGTLSLSAWCLGFLGITTDRRPFSYFAFTLSRSTADGSLILRSKWL